MCGISGMWRRDTVSVTAKRLKPFTDAIAHRGPDGAGYYIDEQANVGLGHRRLSILDVSDAGHQPMPYANRRYWISYNGEVFNFVELRAALKKEGHTFRSDCDTEVVAAAYAQWGSDCLEKMNGMWALAVWDTHQSELFLARDRYGIKPLHYATYDEGRAFAFASETIAFAHLPGMTRRFNKGRLRLALVDPRALEGEGHTIYENVYQVLPGHCIRLRADGTTHDVTQKRWWTPQHANRQQGDPDPEAAYDDQRARFAALFRDACNIRMRSDVPLASALSGGLDSSSVYCMLHDLHAQQGQDPRAPGDWQRAFIASFPGTAKDETDHANRVVAHTGGRSTHVYPGSMAGLSGWKEATVLFDAIYSDPNFVIATLYGAMQDRGIKVSMDGHGVDEMMYGYPSLVQQAYHVASTQGHNAYAKDIAATHREMYGPHATPPTLDEKTHKARWRQFKQAAKRVLPSAVVNRLRRTASHWPHFEDWQAEGSVPELPALTDTPIDSAAYAPYQQPLVESFYQTTLPPILRNFDRASMQHGVEIRMPFMDWRLVEFVFSLPVKSLLRNGYTKRILRDTMAPLLPHAVQTRTEKVGITAPMQEWMSTQLANDIRNIVHTRLFLNADAWNGPQIRDDVEAMYASNTWSAQAGYRIWPFINAYVLMEHAESNRLGTDGRSPKHDETVTVEGEQTT